MSVIKSRDFEDRELGAIYSLCYRESRRGYGRVHSAVAVAGARGRACTRTRGVLPQVPKCQPAGDEWWCMVVVGGFRETSSLPLCCVRAWTYDETTSSRATESTCIHTHADGKSACCTVVAASRPASRAATCPLIVRRARARLPIPTPHPSSRSSKNYARTHVTRVEKYRSHRDKKELITKWFCVRQCFFLLTERPTVKSL